MMTNMLEDLEKTAARVPDRVAFYDDSEKMTFAQLRQTAQRIGSALSVRVQPRAFVALLLDARSIRNIPALYGVLYAGCAYAPLDITMPPERLRMILELLSPAMILSDEKGKNALAALAECRIPSIDYAEAAAAPVEKAALDRVRGQSRAMDPMSVLYTSGSTGIPKGSVQTHDSYIHWTQATIDVYQLDENTVFGNQSPFFYANSIIDIFPPVALGATVYLLPQGVLTFPKKLIACLNERHVTELTMTPSSFISVANSGALTKGCLPELKWGIMSGEPMPWQPLQTWMEAAPAAGWWNFYGSTEMFSVAVGRIEKLYQGGDRLPVGKVFDAVQLLFLDEEGKEVPPGEPGEMYASSPWVASGYHRDAERTAASWVDNLLGGGKRFYRSGDIGRLTEDGQLMVLGRRDTQIKHIGYRMELGEVEAALRMVPGWADGCVLFQKETGQIFCFYTGALNEKELRRALRERLARYMLPDVFVHLDEMPHTASMKLDRAALVEMMRQN